MNKVLFPVLFLAALFLTSCGGAKFTTNPIDTKIVRTYPDLPPVEPLPVLDLMPFEWDYPRDITQLVPKSTKACLDVPDDKRDGAYWEKCGQHPPLKKSNIFMGLDRQNFEVLMLNNAKLKTRLIQYKTRLDEINRQRAEWRLKNRKAGELLLEEAPPEEK